MKFSVLLPTRNRLDLLAFAVETVRRQDYPDWEVIVSDNFSEEDIAGYVSSLNDPRIKYFRTNAFIPVTDNWNNALAQSDGDYVIMLGDDDCLMPGYFSTLSKIIEQHGAPDFILTGAYLYAYPGVMPGFPDGFLRSYSARKIFQSAQRPFWLETSKAAELVKCSLNFKAAFDYNMQFFLVSRTLINAMKERGSFFQSPYPDYYASNAMMLSSNRVLIVPQPLVVIGISPKSFGFYYYNNLESQGNEFLKNLPDHEMASRLQPIVLPGTDMNNSWLLSMETVANNFADKNDIKVNYNRYRFIQICAVFAGLVLGKSEAKSAVQELRGKMNVRERLFYNPILSIMAALAPMLPERYRSFLAKLIIFAAASHPRLSFPMIEGKFRTILDVFEQMAPANNSEEKAGNV